MKLLRRWSVETFGEGEDAMTLKLKCLSYKDAPEFLKTMEKLGAAARAQTAEGKPDMAAYFEVQKASQAVIEDAFRRFVKIDGELHDEEGTAIKSAEELLADAPQWLVQEVLMRLQTLCVTGEREGKGSRSPSPSASTTSGSGDSSSRATSTESAGGEQPSTASETPDTAASPSAA